MVEYVMGVWSTPLAQLTMLDVVTMAGCAYAALVVFVWAAAHD